MPTKQYYEIELNTDMEEREIGFLQDNRFLCNIDAATFHANKHSILVNIKDEPIRLVLGLISNWLHTIGLAEHITSVKDVTEYTTGFVDKRLDDFIKAGKGKRDNQEKRSRNKGRQRQA